MSIQIRTLVKPFAIVAVMPLGLFGAEATLLLTRTPLHKPSALGALLFAGLMLKDSTIVLSYLKQLQMNAMQPLLMTVLCTLLALLQIALLRSVCAQVHSPATIAIGALADVTLIVMFLSVAFDRVIVRHQVPHILSAQSGSWITQIVAYGIRPLAYQKSRKRKQT